VPTNCAAVRLTSVAENRHTCLGKFRFFSCIHVFVVGACKNERTDGRGKTHLQCDL